MAAKQLKQYRAAREIHRNRIHETFELAIAALDDQSQHSSLKVRFSELGNIYAEFNSCHNSIIQLLCVQEEAAGILEEENEFRKDADDEYFRIKTICYDLFEANQLTFPKVSSVRLPKLNVPNFNGNLKAWPTFIDLFNSLIHENDSLSNIEKFQYLLSVVSGEALSSLKNLPLTNNNYSIAYNTLTSRFQNKRLLANFYWEEIVNAQKITSEASRNLRHLLDIFSDNLQALKNLQFPVESWDFVLFHLLSKKIDSESLKRFELDNSSSDVPTYESLYEFLSKQCKAFDSMGLGKSSMKYNSNIQNKKPVTLNKFAPPFSSSSLLVETKSNVNRCALCKALHTIYQCPTFSAKSPKERYDLVKQNNWCTHCLGSKHTARHCNSASHCRICNSSCHHTLLHFGSNSSDVPQPPHHIAQSNNAETSSESSAINPEIQITSMTNVLPTSSTVLLSTVQLQVLDIRNNFQTIRVLLDSASQASFITEKCCHRLGLKKSNLPLSINGLDQMQSVASNVVTCHIAPLHSPIPVFTVEAAVLPRICADMPAYTFSIAEWSYIANLKLADNSFNVSGPVDMLLGADIFSLILRNGQVVGLKENPIAFNTIFGWILMGKMSSIPKLSPLTSLMTCCDLDTTLKQFWTVEESPQAKICSAEEIQCEDNFNRTHFRTPTGRYVVSLPFKDDIEPHFQDTRKHALRLLNSLERRLTKDPPLYLEYCKFMRDYLDSNHMELAPSKQSSPQVCYIPHHCVINPNSSTTKLRVVFNASSRSSSGLSLNDHLLVGKKLQQDIVALLLNFRTHLYVFTADIKGMYRQILVNECHRDYQRILWRFSPSEEVRDYRLNTVTFGVNSSPFLAIRTLCQLAQDEGKDFPLASSVLTTDIYVDDLVTGSSTLADANELQCQLIKLLGRGGFKLRKWASNHPSLLEKFPLEECQQDHSFDSQDCVIKILGLKWFPSQDYFSYNVIPLDKVCTKRTILSQIARVFDPLGFLTPVVFSAKHLMQYIWSLGLEWDETPPSNVVEKWTHFQMELPLLSKLTISRYFPTSSQYSELHGFADSSERGYAAVVYIRVLHSENEFQTFLIAGKSKVAPLRTLSVPRLELCAAALLAKLMRFILDTYSTRIKFQRIFAWSDSMTTLQWIKSSAHRWHTFVSNKVSQIQDQISPELWHHVRSAENPADCASRGLLPSELVEHPLWFTGPWFFDLPCEKWPAPLSIVPSPEAAQEEKTIVLSSFVSLDTIDSLLEKFSSLNKIKRIVAYCLRFINNLKNPHDKRLGSFSQAELHSALLVLVKRTQHLEFQQEISNLESNSPLSKPFRKLNPFIGDDGLLRVGGRLSHSGLSYDRKHPALLPRKSRLTFLIIQSFHTENLHPGLQTLHFLLVQHFWILSPKRAIRQVLSQCLKCFRAHPVPLQPFMGDLPALRVNQIKPFQCVGVDYGGPFNVTLSKSRGTKSQKAYICLFVCFATKAIHLELASELSTEAFLAALRRFIGRRGRCNRITSDCGTNFVGAKKVLSQHMKEASERENICFSFHAPSSPHFNGLSEAGIKSVKTHLYRVVGSQVLTYEEFNTLLVQIEAILNSRPLCAQSSDPSDLSVLTPGHFLTLEPLTTLPEPDLTHLKMSHLNRWQLLQRLHQDIWRRWHDEYLNTLQQRTKWLKNETPLQIGELVLIKNELTSPLHWRLGRVVKVHPGADGTIRVATVRTSQGEFKRPLVKLCVLPSAQLA